MSTGSRSSGMTSMRAPSSSSEDGMMILMFFFVPLDMMFTAFLFEVAVNGAVHLYASNCPMYPQVSVIP